MNAKEFCIILVFASLMIWLVGMVWAQDMVLTIETTEPVIGSVTDAQIRVELWTRNFAKQTFTATPVDSTRDCVYSKFETHTAYIYDGTKTRTYLLRVPVEPPIFCGWTIWQFKVPSAIATRLKQEPFGIFMPSGFRDVAGNIGDSTPSLIRFK